MNEEEKNKAFKDSLWLENYKSFIEKIINFKDNKIGGFHVMSAKVRTKYKIIKNKKYYDIIFYEGKSGDEILQRANINEINFLKLWIKKIFLLKK